MFGSLLRRRQREIGPVDPMDAPIQREQLQPAALAQSFKPTGLRPVDTLMEAERMRPAQSADLKAGAPNPAFAPKRGFMGKLLNFEDNGLSGSDRMMMLGAMLKDAGGDGGNVQNMASILATRQKQAREDAQLEAMRAFAAKLGPDAEAALAAGDFDGYLGDMRREELQRSRPDVVNFGGKLYRQVDGELEEIGDVAPTFSDELSRDRFDYDRSRDPVEDAFKERGLRVREGQFGLSQSREFRVANKAKGGGRSGAAPAGGRKPWEAFR